IKLLTEVGAPVESRFALPSSSPGQLCPITTRFRDDRIEPQIAVDEIARMLFATNGRASSGSFVNGTPMRTAPYFPERIVLFTMRTARGAPATAFAPAPMKIAY